MAIVSNHSALYVQEQMVDIQKIVTEAYKILNTLNIAGFASCLTDDVHYTLGCIAKGTGKEDLIEVLKQLFSQTITMEHELLHMYESGNRVVVEVEATYIRKDQNQILLSGVIFLKIDKGLISVLKVYQDFTPLLG